MTTQRAAWRRARGDFGLRYAATMMGLRMIRSLSRKAAWMAERRLMLIEAERGVLGPAHRGYSQHSPVENEQMWTSYDWSWRGEEWDRGNPEFTASITRELLVPAIAGARTVLEIGPGGGRWSGSIIDRAERTYLVDVTERVLELCRERFAERDGVTYLPTDGRTLDGVPSGEIDAVWSFDVFVHIAPVDVAGYLGEIARVLRPGGVAAIHHSGRPRRFGETAWRSPMTATLFASLAREHGLRVDRQLGRWPGGAVHHDDVITFVTKP